MRRKLKTFEIIVSFKYTAYPEIAKDEAEVEKRIKEILETDWEDVRILKIEEVSNED